MQIAGLQSMLAFGAAARELLMPGIFSGLAWDNLGVERMGGLLKWSGMLLTIIATGCTSAPSGGWKDIPQKGRESRLERAKAICQGRAAETQVAAGRYWIMGAAASNSTFRACMAEHGFTQG